MVATLNISKVKQALLNQAKKLHYLTNDEILNQIPEPEKHIQEIDDIFDYLFEHGVDVFDKVESKEVIEIEKEKNTSADLLSLLHLSYVNGRHALPARQRNQYPSL